MDVEEIIKNDKYYEKDSYNVFDTFSIHGLNIEGIKRYYSIPINKKYYHMIKVKKDLDEIISKHLIEKEKRKKNYKSNRYDDERLYKMYSGEKKERSQTLENTLFQKEKIIKKPTKIKIIDDNTKKINKEELKQKILNTNPNNINRKIFNNIAYSTLNKYMPKKTCNKNISYSVKRSKNKSEDNIMNLPILKPRKIIIDCQLVNGAGISGNKKNFGHNFFMGSSYNPQNYYVNSKNRTKRNVFGGLFVN